MEESFNKKVSIIVPIYNCEKNLKKCLNSLLNQTYKNLEIILIDDGSIDSSLKICKEFQNKSEKIFVYLQKNSGPSVARNHGIEKSTGDYIFFCDSDDYIDNNVIELLVNNYKDSNLIGVMHKNVINSNTELCTYENIYSTRDYIYNTLLGKTFGNVWGYLFDSNKIKHIAFDKNTMCMEDFLFVIQYLQKFKIKNVKFIENAYYYYVLNEDGITASKNNNIEICIKKCKSYFYSLKLIDINTNFEFSNIINNQKVKILENYMCLSTKDKNSFKRFETLFNIEKYNGNSIRYKIFSKLFINKMKILINVYFIIIKSLKYLRRGLNGKG